MHTTRCEYTFTYQDFLSSMKCYRRMSKRAALGYVLYVWLIPLGCVLAGIYLLFSMVRSDQDLSNTSAVLLALAFGVGWGLPARYRMGLRRAFNQRNALAKSRPMFCEFDDVSIRFIVPGGTEVSYVWKSFTQYMENDRVTVLFIKDAAFHTIPKRAMDEADWQRFRRLADANVRIGNAD